MRRSIRKQEVHECVWYCGMCGKSHREYVRCDLDEWQHGDRDLLAAGWEFVPTSGDPFDVLSETALFFCPDHHDAARLMRLVVQQLGYDAEAEFRKARA